MIDASIINGIQHQMAAVAQTGVVSSNENAKENIESIIVRMDSSEKESLKVFCALKHISMNQFINLAIDNLRTEIEHNQKSVSKYGIKEVR